MLQVLVIIKADRAEVGSLIITGARGVCTGIVGRLWLPGP